ncbi:MAG TPA: apolipoprotein N-acyltransferase [Elusimicrobiota bacterium]|nr:apolipoprotein N-acyltransferase [Elusimicrobiota bacterium]
MLEWASLALGGCLLASAYWPGGRAAAAWVAFLPFLWAIRGRRPVAAFLRGWAFGAAAWTAGMHWMLQPMREYLRVGPAAGLFLFALTWSFHGSVFGLAAWACARAARPVGRALGLDDARALALVFVPIAVAGEGFFPMLMPTTLALSQHNHLPALQSMELFGAAGLAWLLAGFNAALFLAIQSKGRVLRPLGALLALALANEAYGRARIAQIDAATAAALARAPLRVGIVQAAIPSGPPRWTGSMLVAQGGLTSGLLARGPLDLVVWPESTFGAPLEYERREQDAGAPTIDGWPVERFLRAAVPYAVPMLLNTRGIARGAGQGPQEGYNVAFLAGADKRLLGLTEKRVLFPFGEFVPGARRWPILYRLSPRSARLSRGRSRLLETPSGARFGVLICYEDLLADEARDLARRGAQFLVTMTDDAWFRGMGPDQHLMGALPRAIESRLFVVRAANYGISAIIDPAGRVLDAVPAGARGTVRGAVAALEARTPFLRVGRAPYWAALVLLIALLAFAARLDARRAPPLHSGR